MTKLNPTQTNDYILSNSISRQAIINGNFDIWQRSTSTSAPANTTFVADRWKTQTSGDSGTLPTVVHSRQVITSGDIPNSFYHYRIAPNGAGTSLGVNSYGVINQPIENGTRLLCGNGKKITVSFYARSDIANKKLGVQLQQNYGTGGSPTAEEAIAGQTISLTTSWVKYTATFTTNTLASKTFGTANDDKLDLLFWVMWGSTIGTARGLTGTETYVGSGYIDIAQVQLCAGDVALPFMPKSFDEELRACQRYCYKIGGYAAYEGVGLGIGVTTAKVNVIVIPPTTMRTQPTLTYNGTWQTSGGIDFSSAEVITDQSGIDNFVVQFTQSGTSVTSGALYQVRGKNSTSNSLVLSAEL